jgi:hypothetical protein
MGTFEHYDSLASFWLVLEARRTSVIHPFPTEEQQLQCGSCDNCTRIHTTWSGIWLLANIKG